MKRHTVQSEKYIELHKNILTWYQQHGRVTLPWRNTQSSYKIYLSEIMLQQTQVKTVLERFYFPFLTKFPTFQDVANAPVDEVLKAWEGLGYYTRARNLHKTAQATSGILPNSAKALEKLSGIGKSTAHAVACFAFDEALPILDANVKRILYRFFAVKKCTDKELWQLAYTLFDKENAYIYNQTLMDIGATLCKHKTPECNVCPFESMCQGKKNPLLYPEKKVKKKKPIRTHFMLIYHHNNHYALKQNTTQLLGGLWAFPQFESFESKSKKITELGDLVHHYTHFRLDAKVLLVHQKINNIKWFSFEQIDQLAMSGADRKALAMLKGYELLK
ncbi:MAG TPA: A/G-specific adenine glycosylase [Campylobacterales bacterium]|nr:A/G-specific adenine glycosylase [Campylobacterales bacterium]